VDTRQIEKVYSAYSGFYDLLFGKVFHDSRADAIRLLDLEPGQTVLEVGVGTGLSLTFYPRHCRVVGIDLSQPMLERSREKVNRYGLRHIELQRMDATRMTFEEDRFDAVVAAYVMSTAPNPRRVLSEMVRVCRPGGRIVMVNHFSNGNRLVSAVERWISPLCTRIGFRTDLSLEGLLSGAPLAVLSAQKVNPFHYWSLVYCENRKSATIRGSV
jgi:phosphatidylethanolamine/phosphatidyl-N-methylethanolamine N-methyltransferase